MRTHASGKSARPINGLTSDDTMNHDPFHWGRPLDSHYGGYNHHIANASNTAAESKIPTLHTQQPTITGTSVVALKYKDGIMMAADNVGAYGSLMRFSNIERLIKVGEETVVGILGDISDLQQIERILDELEIDEAYDIEDGGDEPEPGKPAPHSLRAPHVHEYLSRVLYNRRSKMDPLWNAVVVGGYNDDRTPFLKYVDLLGVTYASLTIATGFGGHLAIPLLRNLIPYDKDYSEVTEEQARECLAHCMRVLFYRDARSMDEYSLVTIKPLEFKHEKGVKVEDQAWRFAKDIRGYGSKQQ